MISMVVDERGKNDFVDPDTSTDSITDTDAHFITHVRVHPAYDGSDVSAEGEEGEPRWVLFNDFCVTPTDVKDAMQMFGHKKVPCMLFYSRRGAQSRRLRGCSIVGEKHVSESEDSNCSFNFEDIKILETGRYDEQIRYIESILLKYDKQNLNTCDRSIKLNIV